MPALLLGPDGGLRERVRRSPAIAALPVQDYDMDMQLTFDIIQQQLDAEEREKQHSSNTPITVWSAALFVLMEVSEGQDPNPAQSTRC
ncbi:hypothetical protein NDU88_007024 [Pleurodeles waltl]|uniref:Uncharacterized protein n=1 Tax=Pleurodeles waltl TaxID=8319 RepID=A0AAV7RRY8_PLEWA|nr:hypothetical protein NDU88_007024 [Pleurodeles waltl]